MKTDNEILLGMLTEAALYPIVEKNGVATVKLQDKPSRQGTVIRNVPRDTLVIKTDAFPAPTSFFRGDEGENKRADYIIISESKKVILFIELKSGYGKAGKIKKQLRGAACVLAYCKEAGKQFWKKASFLGNGYRHRYIGLDQLDAGKRPTIHGRQPHDTADCYMKISSPRYLKFDYLVG